MHDLLSASQQCLARIFAGEVDELQFVGWEVSPEDLDPIFMELSSGHQIVLSMMHCALVESLESMISRPWEYWAIRVYVVGDHYDGRLRRHSEFREGVEFERDRLAEIWEWFADLAASRLVYQFDYVDDLLEHFADYLALNFSVEDAFRHFERLPAVCIPSIFDQWDDSFSNDQND